MSILVVTEQRTAEGVPAWNRMSFETLAAGQQMGRERQQPVEAAGRPVTTGSVSRPGRGGMWKRATPAGPHRMCFAGLVAALSRYSRGPRRKKRDQIAANTIAFSSSQSLRSAS